jgi:tRNA threonylcarbamoyladenosine biosynthesis protein TsaB
MSGILAIDTTTEFGSIALYEPGGECAEVSMHSTDGFGHILFDQIAVLLDRRRRNILDIDCFASAAGPGSFTGVRVGLSAAKGLAEATGKRVVAVSNLRALAWFGTSALRATVIDARRGEIYGAVYDSSLELVQQERVTKFPAWLEGLPENVEFLSTNTSAFAPAVEASRFRGASFVNVPGSLAGAIARIAHLDYSAGRALDPAAVDANYVRRSDAELFWKES